MDNKQTTFRPSDAISLGDSTSEPQITLSPATGPVGTVVTITGKGFKPNTSIAVTFGEAIIIPNSGAIVSDANGNFTATVIMAGTTIGAKMFSFGDGSSLIQEQFTVTGVTVLACPVVSNFNNYLHAYRFGKMTDEVNDDSYDDLCVIDMRGSVELDLFINNIGSSNGLKYEIFGTFQEVSTPPAYDSTGDWLPAYGSKNGASVASLGGSDQTLAQSTADAIQITIQYSWILIRVKRATATLDTAMELYARHRQ